MKVGLKVLYFYFSSGCTWTGSLKGWYDEALFSSDGLAVFSAGAASHSSNNKAASGLSSAVSLKRVTQAPTLVHFSSPAPSLWPSLPLDISLIIWQLVPSFYSLTAVQNDISDLFMSVLCHLPSLSLMLLFSLTHNHNQECTVTLSITILLQKLNFFISQFCHAWSI